MASSNKRSKRNLSESDLENEAANLPRFIVIEYLEEVCLAKFLPLLKEKVISTRASSKTVRKTRRGNLLVEVLFTNPSARAGYDTRSIFKQSLTGLNSEFSFS